MLVWAISSCTRLCTQTINEVMHFAIFFFFFFALLQARVYAWCDFVICYSCSTLFFFYISFERSERHFELLQLILIFMEVPVKRVTTCLLWQKQISCSSLLKFALVNFAFTCVFLRKCGLLHMMIMQLNLDITKKIKKLSHCYYSVTDMFITNIGYNSYFCVACDFIITRFVCMIFHIS